MSTFKGLKQKLKVPDARSKQRPSLSTSSNDLHNISLDRTSSQLSLASETDSVVSSSAFNESTGLFSKFINALESPGGFFASDNESEFGEDLGDLNRKSREELEDMYRRSIVKGQRIKSRLDNAVGQLKSLEREREKLRENLGKQQDIHLRRVSDLKETLAMEREGKQHLERTLRLEMDEQDAKVDSLKTQIKLLKENNRNEHIDDQPDLIQLNGTHGNDLKELRTSSDELRKDFTDLQAYNAQLQTQIQTERQCLNDLKVALASNETDFQKLFNSQSLNVLNDLSVVVKLEAARKNIHLDGSILSENEKLNALSTSYVNEQKLNSSLCAKLKDSLEANERLSEALASKEKEVLHIESSCQCNILQASDKKLLGDIDQLNSTIVDLRQQNDMRIEELRSLKTMSDQKCADLLKEHQMKVVDLENTIHSKAEELSLFTENLSKSKALNESLQTKIIKLQNEFDTLKEANVNLLQNFHDGQKRFKLIENKYDKAVAELEEKSGVVQQLESEQDSLQEKNGDLTASLNSAESDRDEYMQQIKNLQNSIERIQEENRSLLHNLSTAESSITSLKSQIEISSKELSLEKSNHNESLITIDNLQKDLSLVKNEFDSCKRECECLQNIINNFDEKEQSDSLLKINCLEEQILSLKNQHAVSVQNLEDIVGKAEEELALTVSLKNELQDKLLHSESSHQSSIEAHHKEKEAMISDHENSLSKCRHNIDDLIKNNSELLSKVESLKKELLCSNDDYVNLQSKLTTASDEYGHLKIVSEEKELYLNSKIAELNKSLEQKIIDLGKLENTHSDTSAVVEKLNNEIFQMKTVNSNLNVSNNELLTKNSLINTKMNDLRIELVKLEAEFAQLNQTNLKLSEHLENSNDIHCKTEQRNASLVSEINILKEDRSTLNKRIREQESINQEHLKCIETLKTLNEDVTTEQSKMSKEHQSTIAVLTEELENLKSDFFETNSKNKKLEEEIAVTIKEYDEKFKHIRDQKNLEMQEFENEILDHKSTIKSLQSTETELRRELNGRERELKSESENCYKLRESVQTLKARFQNELKSQKKELDSAKASFESQIKSLKQDHQSEVQRLVESHEHIMSEQRKNHEISLSSLKEENEESTSEKIIENESFLNNQWKITMETKQLWIDQLEQENETLAKEINDLKQKLKESQQTVGIDYKTLYESSVANNISEIEEVERQHSRTIDALHDHYQKKINETEQQNQDYKLTISNLECELEDLEGAAHHSLPPEASNGAVPLQKKEAELKELKALYLNESEELKAQLAKQSLIIDDLQKASHREVAVLLPSNGLQTDPHTYEALQLAEGTQLVYLRHVLKAFIEGRDPVTMVKVLLTMAQFSPKDSALLIQTVKKQHAKWL